MRRLLATLAAVLGLTAGLSLVDTSAQAQTPVSTQAQTQVPASKATPLIAPASAVSERRDDNTTVSTGDGDHGTFSDCCFGGPNHHMGAVWDRGNQDAICCGNPVWSSIHLSIHAGFLPDTPAGHHTCVQVAVDWRVPQNASHYDSRIMRVCEPHGDLVWDFSEKSTDNDPPDCVIGGPGFIRVPCSSPMGRVQFGRYDRTTNDVIGPIECRVMAGVAMSDCTSWNPYGSLSASRSRVMSFGGVVTTYGSLDATDPNR